MKNDYLLLGEMYEENWKKYAAAIGTAGALAGAGMSTANKSSVATSPERVDYSQQAVTQPETKPATTYEEDESTYIGRKIANYRYIADTYGDPHNEIKDTLDALANMPEAVKNRINKLGNSKERVATKAAQNMLNKYIEQHRKYTGLKVDQL